MPCYLKKILAALVVLTPFCLGATQDLPGPKKPTPTTPKVDFNAQIRPILSDNCFRCHGPDEHERKAKLRLDVREGAVRKLRSGGFAIVPGKAEESELIARIVTDDPHERMPPPKTNKKVTPAQLELLKQWINQGAPWAEHWAFVATERPVLPGVKQDGWARNGIDRFILARLEAEGLRPTAETDRIRLARRLALDLTGLPPTPEEVDAFVNDQRPDAYEQLVDRLMASPHFGERLAVDWLDAARFADTHGYHIDAGRDMSRWREWVIDAFNGNMPFDQFTVEQLAGDLLPGATAKQKIASGFNRNHMINFEGGAIPQEYHNAYIVDRVNTTSTVFLGLTVACAQCHDHKYDPISQKEFYQLYAFFHNVPENGLDGSQGNAAPLIRVPARQQEVKIAEIDLAIKKIEAQLSAPSALADQAQAAWEKTALADVKVVWTVLDPRGLKSKGGATLTKLGDKSILAGGVNPATETYAIVASTDLKEITGVRLEALPDDSFTARGPGRSINGNIVMTNFQLRASVGRTLLSGQPVKIKSASADFSQKDFPIANALLGIPSTGWGIHPEVGKAHTAVFEVAQPIKNDGKLELEITLAFQSKFANHQIGRFRLSVTNTANPHGRNTLPAEIVAILATPAEKRTDQAKAALSSYFRTHISAHNQELTGALQKLRAERTLLEKGTVSAMVMQEMATPRDTFILMRGEYDKKGEKVTAAVPKFLPALTRDQPSNRLGLARWLTSDRHPLTARVAINRYWQMFFGTGLVKTAEDFGSQGERPSHPELLDWLAVEFMSPSSQPLGNGSKTAWNVKAMIRLMVTSATYRQSSAVTPALLAKDPDNRLLARGPRFRLQAEFIRDQALAVSGLLNREIGGASVFPYQPAGLWQELASRGDSRNWSAQFYTQSKGKDLYRRTMYTFWKRTSPPPTLATFDAPDRETCTVRRSRTNTPLQALVLMNDPTYVEAARKLAERLMTEAGTPEDRITLAFRLTTGRRPNEKESAVLGRIYAKQLVNYQQDPKAALKLLTVGESARHEKLAVAELAAWTIVASTVLNLDETLTKN